MPARQLVLCVIMSAVAWKGPGARGQAEAELLPHGATSGTLTCWGSALTATSKRKQPRGLGVLGNAMHVETEVCGFDHFTVLETKQQFQ